MLLSSGCDESLDSIEGVSSVGSISGTDKSPESTLPSTSDAGGPASVSHCFLERDFLEGLLDCPLRLFWMRGGAGSSRPKDSQYADRIWC